MSANNDETETSTDDDSGVTPSYREEGQANSVDEKLRERKRQKQEQQLKKQAKTESGRNLITSEEESGAPEDSLENLLKTEDLEFRGVTFTFSEPGDAILEASKYNDENVEQGTEAAEFVYRTLGKKCMSKDEEFWRNFDLGQEGGDGVMDLFNRYVEAFQDIDPEEREKIEEFRAE